MKERKSVLTQDEIESLVPKRASSHPDYFAAEDNPD